jgi:hypothetical protein
MDDLFLQVPSFLDKVSLHSVNPHSRLLILFDIGLQRQIEVLKVGNHFEVLMEFLMDL